MSCDMGHTVLLRNTTIILDILYRFGFFLIQCFINGSVSKMLRIEKPMMMDAVQNNGHIYFDMLSSKKFRP
jgi:hypothetical protein